MTRSKRSANVIDLTSDDESTSLGCSSNKSSAHRREPKQPRNSYIQHTATEPFQTHVNLIDSDDDDDDVDDGSQEAPNATQGQEERQYAYVLYGVMKSKIVGVRYYDGVATIGEMVIVRREPHNQYDRNAIQVLNVHGHQIGHVPRSMAEKLAKYMDDRSLSVEALITGPKGHFDCPIELKFFGTTQPVEREELLHRMRSDHLPVGQAMEKKRKDAKKEKETQRLAKQAAKEAKKKGALVVEENPLGEFAGGMSQSIGPGPSIEDIIGSSERFNPRNMERTMEEFSIKEEELAAMAQAAQPISLNTQLHAFQLQGLKWMLDREAPELPAKGTKDIVQLWQRHSRMPQAFTHLATNFSVIDPALASGGILADDMGLGKTLQVISLILADRALNRKATDTSDATLILAPVSVMSNWSSQMRKHIKEEHMLRIMFWHGMRKEPITPKHIRNHDIVISTYESVSADWWSQASTKLPRQSGPFSIKWRRIVLDEGHSIRNPKAKKTIAITNLMAQSRWSLTGTPIINSLKDLYSQVRFLRLSGGLDSLQIFHGAIMRPVLQGDVHGNRILQTLMSSICLRRKKEMSFINLQLPEISEYIHKVKLHAHEQEKYDALEAQAKGTLEIYRRSLGKQNTADTYRHLLEVLLRLRQVCNHWQLVGEERLDSVMKDLEGEDIVDLTEESKIALQKMLRLVIDSQEDCPICLDTLKEPVITKCAHYFCSSCVERVIDTQKKCPMCRIELESLGSATVKPAKEISKPFSLPTQEDMANQTSLEKNTSTKTEALLDILKASSRDPTNKTIVFSQWTSFLDLLQPHLKAHGLGYTRIDGSMSATDRDSALEALDSDPQTTVMLASLSVCSVGLNLVAANQVIMADSWWAPAIEDQAVDRVHRLGQTRETKVFRLVVQDSVEERVLGIQEEKRKLMQLAFSEKSSDKKKRRGAGTAGLADLMRLLGHSDQESHRANQQ